MMTTITRDDVKALERSIAKIEKGWMQGFFRETVDGQTKFCMAGAITASTKSEARRRRLEGLISEQIAYTNIVTYNDMKGRQKRQVVAVMRRALKVAKKRAGIK